MTLRAVIQEVQKTGQKYGFIIVIVGGAFVRLIGKKTTIKALDETKHTIVLSRAENPSTIRPEDNKTIVDIDCIAFSASDDPYASEIKDAFSRLLKALKTLQKEPGFPAVSIEPALYHPNFPKPNTLLQFVSSIETYQENQFFFRLGNIVQEVRAESLQPWIYTFDYSDDQIVSFSPLAIQKRYLIRGFSVKPKDQEKIFGPSSVYAGFVEAFNKKTKNVYAAYFSTWDEFAHRIAKNTAPSIQIKRFLWNTYWNTIGTYLAHGTGAIGKLLLPLGNTLFAGK